MIEQNVQVLRCSDEQLWVRLGSQSGCSACDNGKGCGAGLFAKLIQRKPVVLELARKDLDASAGQMLTLAFPEKLYLKLVFLYYGLPLLAALAGAYAGYALSTSFQLSLVLVDLLTLFTGILLAWFIMRLIRARSSMETILNSLDITVCFTSATPGMCGSPAKQTEQH